MDTVQVLLQIMLGAEHLVAETAARPAQMNIHVLAEVIFISAHFAAHLALCLPEMEMQVRPACRVVFEHFHAHTAHVSAVFRNYPNRAFQMPAARRCILPIPLKPRVDEHEACNENEQTVTFQNILLVNKLIHLRIGSLERDQR
jgi:hypothetical protein